MSMIAEAEGSSVLHGPAEREGVVCKANLPRRISFKAISNRFLIKAGK